MQATQATGAAHTVLVPVIGGDVGPAVFDRVRALLTETGARLVLLHVAGAREDGPTSSETATPAGPRTPVLPLWRRLAAGVSPGRVFVDALSGDPASAVLSHADRFGCDAIVLGAPERAAPRASQLQGLIVRLRGAVPGRLLVVDRCAAPRTRRATRPPGMRSGPAKRAERGTRARVGEPA